MGQAGDTSWISRMRLNWQGRSSSQNLVATLSLWTIAALVPLALMIMNPLGRLDFNVLWIGGKLALSGGAGQVYDPVAAGAVAESIGFPETVIFPYPPHALFFFIPFAALAPFPAYLAWNLLTAAIFCWAARPWLPDGFPLILALTTPAALICLDFGQTGLLFGGLWMLAFQGRWPAVSLLSFKPHLALPSILSLRNRSQLCKAGLILLLLLALSSIAFGASLWIEFVQHTLGHAADIGTRKRWLYAGVSPAFAYGFWGWILFATASVLLLIRNANVFTAATAALLISPYGFHYDMPVACLGFGLVIFQHWHAMPIRHRMPVTLGFLAPVIALVGAWWVPPILAWALWVQVKYPLSGSNAAEAS